MLSKRTPLAILCVVCTIVGGGKVPQGQQAYNSKLAAGVEEGQQVGGA